MTGHRFEGPRSRAALVALGSLDDIQLPDAGIVSDVEMIRVSPLVFIMYMSSIASPPRGVATSQITDPRERARSESHRLVRSLVGSSGYHSNIPVEFHSFPVSLPEPVAKREVRRCESAVTQRSAPGL